MIFTYRSKGTADDWTNEAIEAVDIDEAQRKLDSIYGIRRDNAGNQTNEEVVKVEIISSSAE